MLPPNTLKDQVAIITGGGTGLGRAIANEFSRLGAKLVLASRSMEHLSPSGAEIEKAGGEAIAVQTDVRDPEQVDRMIAAAYLVSPYADYINGENLTLDGGAWLGKGFLAVQ